jgi:hypothetical protein
VRALLLPCFALLVFCVGCQRSSDTGWLDVRAVAAQRQSTNNLAQFGLAVTEEQERIGPLEAGKKGRKLVYHAETDLLVENLSEAERDLARLLRRHDGILASAETVTRTGAPRSGLWRLRVPVDQFDDFLEALGGLGEVQRSKRDVQDVTRSYSELEEQIRNMAAEAKGLRQLLEKPAAKLADTLTVREQLAKVTREMKALEARLQRMRDQAEYSTVTLRMLERSGYLAGGGASLGTSAGRAFEGSWQTLIACARAVVVFAAVLGPWLPLAAVAVVPIWMWRRRRRATASGVA